MQVKHTININSRSLEKYLYKKNIFQRFLHFRRRNTVRQTRGGVEKGKKARVQQVLGKKKSQTYINVGG